MPKKNDDLLSCIKGISLQFAVLCFRWRCVYNRRVPLSPSLYSWPLIRLYNEANWLVRLSNASAVKKPERSDDVRRPLDGGRGSTGRRNSSWRLRCHCGRRAIYWNVWSPSQIYYPKLNMLCFFPAMDARSIGYFAVDKSVALNLWLIGDRSAIIIHLGPLLGGYYIMTSGFCKIQRSGRVRSERLMASITAINSVSLSASSSALSCFTLARHRDNAHHTYKT